MMMKKLCRIKLVNWHYFENLKPIEVNGSFLITGENKAGKSTTLDAIQLVLTTNKRNFNKSANEDSSRDLKGYVRCKLGNEGQAYLRTGHVISYIALEFFEEKTSKYFTIGVKIDSPDETVTPTTKWFCEDCKLEELTFVTDGRPSTEDQFKKNDKKVQLIQTDTEARARFRRRLGNLEDRFFSIIPKSLAFKPMKNVKDFINEVILPEVPIEVANLRDNIATVKELEELVKQTKEKINELNIIKSKKEDIEAKEQDIRINEIMIKKADIEAKKLEINELGKEKYLGEQKLGSELKTEQLYKEVIDKEEKRLINLKTALMENGTAQLIKDTMRELEKLEEKQQATNIRHKKYQIMLSKITDSLAILNKYGIQIITRDELAKLSDMNNEDKEKSQIIFKLKKLLDETLDKYNTYRTRETDKREEFIKQRSDLQENIKNLTNKKLKYPDNTIKLKNAIENEFRHLGINGEVKIFSDLLRIEETKWQNAIEGYLNTQRHYIIVAPEFYKIALEVYDKIKKDVHTVGLVNTCKLDINATIDRESLAHVINSENRYAKAYAIYLLNRVIRCEEVQNLKNYRVAITVDCMLYQNYAVRKISEEVYKDPFIGDLAYEVQLTNNKTELDKVTQYIRTTDEKLYDYEIVISSLKTLKFEDLEENINALKELKVLESFIAKEKVELKKAETDSTYIQIQCQIEEVEEAINNQKANYNNLISLIATLKAKLEGICKGIEIKNKEVIELEDNLNHLCEKDSKAEILGLNKFIEESKVKQPATIAQNFKSYTTGLETQKDDMCEDLQELQHKYCSRYECELGIGYKYVDEYMHELNRLVTADIEKYEEESLKAKEVCEQQFKEAFLARLKENIENARLEMRNLNIALQNIPFGEDTYQFEITHNKSKENLYKMITSKDNEPNFTLFYNTFENEYKEEIEELFTKLTADDDNGKKVVAEYSDYRNYLDYDIIIHKRSGAKQRFSQIYGDKSGAETQIPYYVAIASSFAQLYKHGDTIRIIMLDEAFDKMDDNHINAMMEFFTSLKFQVILATTPAKMEIIGEKVETILVATREDTKSQIWVYKYAE
jgi:uncharacterized protein YPO0396